MTEDELQGAIIGVADRPGCAQLLGWRVAHFRPAETTKGWRTPVSADGAGFPDLCMVHPEHHRILFVELKAENGKLRLEQQAWLAMLLSAVGDNVDVDVWRPSDWTSGRVEQVLRGKLKSDFESQRLQFGAVA